MRISIVGGGPAGLYLAYLLKMHESSHEVVVHEQNASKSTFGFGVVLADRTVESLRQADSASCKNILAATQPLSHQTLTHRGEQVLVDRTRPGRSIARLQLLEILQNHCAQMGVAVVHRRRIDSLGELRAADLIVGADGVNSQVRRILKNQLGTRVSQLENRFAWYGAAHAYTGSALTFRREGDWVFIAHYYRFSERMSTFVVECDRKTWSRYGFGKLSDAQRKRVAERVFAEDLRSNELVTNRSTWRRFPLVSNARWSVGNVVLIGDALRSIHFSIGSGTRAALEDAIALSRAIREHGNDVSAALRAFEAERRPSINWLGAAATRSYRWYENVRDAMERLSPLDFTYDFMTRTGRMDDERLRRDHPQFMRQYENHRKLTAGTGHGSRVSSHP